MTREEVIQIAEEVVQNSATKSIIMFLELNDNNLFPKPLPPAKVRNNKVVFDWNPQLNDGTPLIQDPDYINPEHPEEASWRMGRLKENLLEGFTWFSIGTFRGNGSQIGDWTTPILAKIGRDGEPGKNGRPGGDGADGTSIEYIFRLAEDEQQFNDFATPYSDPSITDYVPTVENGGVPEGDEQYGDWYDHPNGVSLDYRIESMCFRKRDTENNQWSEFYGPYKWSVWGNNGRDGDGVEYIFKIATLDGENAEAEYDVETATYHLKEAYWPPVSQEAWNELPQNERDAWSIYDAPEYPKGWKDDPQDVNDDYPVQFVSIRKYNGEEGKWGFFSEPTCWNKIPLTDSVVTAFTAFAFCVTSKDISGYKPTHEHSSSMDPDPDDFDYQGEHIVWSDSIPSSGTGYVWMTTSVWRDGEITEEGWSYPMKVNDSPGFQAEYATSVSDDPEHPEKGYNWDTKPKLPNFGEGEWAENESAWRAKALEMGCGEWKDCRYDDPEHYIEDPTFMATCQKKDGVWTDWVVTKIKGENGLSPVVLHIGNDTIAIGVNDENKTTAAATQTITAEIQIGGDELEIDPTKVTYTTYAGGNLPAGFVISNPRVDTSRKQYSAEITVPTDFNLTEQFKIKMNITGSGYDAYNIIRIVGVPGGAGATYGIVIDGGYLDIDRTFTQSGDCVYTPDRLMCHGVRSIGLNDPVPYGELKYSVSTSLNDYKFQIMERYEEKTGVYDYPSVTGIVINTLQNHQNLKAIYLYLVNENGLVIDTEIVEIDTEGEYFINLETDKIVVKDGVVTPSEVKVWTGYKTSKTDAGTIINNHKLQYYLDGDSSHMNVSTNRNNNAIRIINLSGFDASTTKTITFVLTNDSGSILTDPKSISVTEQPADGAPGRGLDNMKYWFKANNNESSIHVPEVTTNPSSAGWTENARGIRLSKDLRFLWCFVRWEFNDGEIKQSAAYIVQRFNDQMDFDYNQIKSKVEQQIQEDLGSVNTRIGNIENTYAVQNIDSANGLISIITNYKDSQQKSFADIIVDSKAATIKNWVGSEFEDKTGRTLTGVKSELDGIEGRITNAATQARNGAVSDARTEWSAADAAITSTVYTKDETDTKMSVIEQKAGKISLLVGDSDHPNAGIQIIANARTQDSKIVLEASNVIINGGLSSGIITTQMLQANVITDVKQAVIEELDVTNLTAGKVKTVGTTGLNTMISNGLMGIYNGAINENNPATNRRAAFGIENGDVVLKFYDSSGQPMYNLGPAGFVDKNGRPVYDTGSI